MTDNQFNLKHESDNWQLVAEGDWLVGQKFAIDGRAVLGRDSSCDITIPGTHLSRRHAELEVRGKKLIIRDLDSSNGTYVNNQKITEAELNAGDTVRFDVLIFRIHGPSDGPDTNATMIREIPKELRELSKKPKPAAPTKPKNWKTKPTSVGNRDATVQVSLGKKAATSVWTVLAIVVGLATVAGLGYLFTQL